MFNVSRVQFSSDILYAPRLKTLSGSYIETLFMAVRVSFTAKSYYPVALKWLSFSEIMAIQLAVATESKLRCVKRVNKLPLSV